MNFNLNLPLAAKAPEDTERFGFNFEGLLGQAADKSDGNEKPLSFSDLVKAVTLQMAAARRDDEHAGSAYSQVRVSSEAILAEPPTDSEDVSAQLSDLVTEQEASSPLPQETGTRIVLPDAPQPAAEAEEQLQIALPALASTLDAEAQSAVQIRSAIPFESLKPLLPASHAFSGALSEGLRAIEGQGVDVNGNVAGPALILTSNELKDVVLQARNENTALVAALEELQPELETLVRTATTAVAEAAEPADGAQSPEKPDLRIRPVVVAVQSRPEAGDVQLYSGVSIEGDTSDSAIIFRALDSAPKVRLVGQESEQPPVLRVTLPEGAPELKAPVSPSGASVEDPLPKSGTVSGAVTDAPVEGESSSPEHPAKRVQGTVIVQETGATDESLEFSARGQEALTKPAAPAGQDTDRTQRSPAPAAVTAGARTTAPASAPATGPEAAPVPDAKTEARTQSQPRTQDTPAEEGGPTPVSVVKTASGTSDPIPAAARDRIADTGFAKSENRPPAEPESTGAAEKTETTDRQNSKPAKNTVSVEPIETREARVHRTMDSKTPELNPIPDPSTDTENVTRPAEKQPERVSGSASDPVPVVNVSTESPDEPAPALPRQSAATQPTEFSSFSTPVAPDGRTGQPDDLTFIREQVSTLESDASSELEQNPVAAKTIRRTETGEAVPVETPTQRPETVRVPVTEAPHPIERAFRAQESATPPPPSPATASHPENTGVLARARQDQLQLHVLTIEKPETQKSEEQKAKPRQATDIRTVETGEPKQVLNPEKTAAVEKLGRDWTRALDSGLRRLQPGQGRIDAAPRFEVQAQQEPAAPPDSGQPPAAQARPQIQVDQSGSYQFTGQQGQTAAPEFADAAVKPAADAAQNVTGKSTGLTSPRSAQQTASFENIKSQVALAAKGDQSRVIVRLKPAHLGQIRMDIGVRNGVMAATLAVENREVEALLRSGVGQLARALAEQGIQVERVEFAPILNQPDGYRSEGKGEMQRDRQFDEERNRRDAENDADRRDRRRDREQPQKGFEAYF